MGNTIVLGIETSCDDTSVCLLKQQANSTPKILSLKNVVPEELFSSWGGVVPEIAARNHMAKLTPLIAGVYQEAGLTLEETNLIAVTTNPGLLGPLLTGVNVAKTLSLITKAPIVPVNHLYAHIEAIHLSNNAFPPIVYPYLGVVVSGGHTLFLLANSSNDFEILGGTLDDAAGEALDKGGKMLGLGYPAGQAIDELAADGKIDKNLFPIGLKKEKNSDLSYSGVKTALKNFLQKNPVENLSKQKLSDVCASYQHAVMEAINLKLKYALDKAKDKAHKDLPIVVGGGVACNIYLRKILKDNYLNVYFVEPKFCTDNGAMIANYGLRTHDALATPYPRSLEVDANSRFIQKSTLLRKARSKPRANKKLGQHFLHDQSVVKKIVADLPKEANVILEVGPGIGVLSKELSKLNMPLYLIEKDTRFTPTLEQYVPKSHITEKDALEINLDQFITSIDAHDEKIWFVSNLPYNVGVPLIMKFIRCRQINHLTIMLQKEVADKIVPKKEKNSMSSLLAIMQNFFECQVITKVSAGSFSPAPKVKSTVLSCKRRKNPSIALDEINDYENFLRRLFNHKRKQIGKILTEINPQANWSSSVESSTRAESLDLDKIQELYKKTCYSS